MQASPHDSGARRSAAHRGYVEPRSRVLDVGCGDGTLLRLLAEEKEVDARGIELSQPVSTTASAKGFRSFKGCRHGFLPAIPTKLRLCNSIPDIAGDTPAAQSVEQMLRIAATRLCRFRISAIGASGSKWHSADACRRRAICLLLV